MGPLVVENTHGGTERPLETSDGRSGVLCVLYFYWTKTNVVKCLYLLKGWGKLTFRKIRKEMQCHAYSINKFLRPCSSKPEIYFLDKIFQTFSTKKFTFKRYFLHVDIKLHWILFWKHFRENV